MRRRVLGGVALFMLAVQGAPAVPAGRAPCWSGGAMAGSPPAVATRRLHGVPVVVRSPARVTRAPILLWHGFGPPASAQAMMQALPLDDVAAEKIYVGLPLFGDRAPPGGLAEIARRQSDDYLVRLLAPVATGVAADLRVLDATLRQQGCLRPHEAIDVVGYSAGGFAVLYGLNDSAVRVRRLVLLNAPASATVAASLFEHATQRPYAWTEASRQLARHYDPAGLAATGAPLRALLPALLLLQGTADDAAVREGGAALEQALRPSYRAARRDAQLALRPLPGMGHGWLTDPERTAVSAAVTAWLNNAL